MNVSMNIIGKTNIMKSFQFRPSISAYISRVHDGVALYDHGLVDRSDVVAGSFQGLFRTPVADFVRRPGQAFSEGRNEQSTTSERRRAEADYGGRAMAAPPGPGAAPPPASRRPGP